MGPQFEGGPSGGEYNYEDDNGGQSFNRQDRETAIPHRGHPSRTNSDLSRHAVGPGINDGGNNGPSGRERDYESRNISGGERNQSRSRTGKSSGQVRICKKCGENLTGQFVRALNGTFHLDCFRCKDCGEIVASKFFPVDDEEGTGEQYPLCETDYFRRLDLLCHQCGGALRGSYITALDQKYHIDHFTCSVCPTIFGASDSYYEHDGKVYCHYHYSTHFAQRCTGCQTAILKQFVEIFRGGQNQHWHPECYMIHKFWNVKLASDTETSRQSPQLDNDMDEAGRNAVREDEERMEEKVYRIWSVLSTFEESSAACISDMLLHVSNGAYVDGVLVAKKFIWHVDILFNSADQLDSTLVSQGMPELKYAREAKLLCKKIVSFFALLSKQPDKGVRKLGVTQELLSLVTALAHYLKLLIRMCLSASLKVERERQDSTALDGFLNDLANLDAIRNDDKSLEVTAGMSGLADLDSDQCASCKRPIEDECVRLGERRWHIGCLVCQKCSRELGYNVEDVRWSEGDSKLYCPNCESRSHDTVDGFQLITRLQQYVFLLRVALARLLATLRTSGTLPHTSDDPNLNGYDSSEGHRVGVSIDPPRLDSESRSKSYGGTIEANPRESSYESTLNDVRRLRSTRMDEQLASSFRKARTSRIIDGPEGRSVRPGSSGGDGSDSRTKGMQIVEERDIGADTRTELMFGHQDALTLDDIPRIVAVEQAKEQRPNAYKHARHDMFRTSVTEPKLINGHQRKFSSGNELDLATTIVEQSPQRGPITGKRHFSDLSALEYFMVRHIAAILMQPLLDGHFTLEELLGLIETKKPTFWDKLGQAFKTDGRKGSKKKGIFGVPLDTLLERDGANSTEGIGSEQLRIPALVDEAVRTMRKMDLSVEGVFRKNGNIKRLNETMTKIDSQGVDAVDLSKENVVQVAALLKKFLRELPDPLLTFKLHSLWIAAQKIGDEDKQRRVHHLTCCLLPKSHRDCLEVLCTFLNWAASFSQIDEENGSKMDSHNLATVIAPNVLYSSAKNPGMDDSFLAIEAVHSLIEFNEQMCTIPEDLQSIISDSSVWNGSGEMTTKEILKRYGDIATNGIPKPKLESVDSGLSRSKEGSMSGRALAPVVTRVDTDPFQAHATQKESSVRHIQDSNQPFNGPPSCSNNSNNNISSLPQQQQQWMTNDVDNQPSPYIFRPPDTTTAEGRRQWRKSGWGRYAPGQQSGATNGQNGNQEDNSNGSIQAPPAGSI